ncbi:Endoglucanase [Labilithrix luteola]|uniref:Endoglucanase n=1 Tax=Labilithrix luteola TaxID=1391654 RepID=A0A0K1PYQ6_9BACT|nr:Endoglucanase [Labilithrix luteola]
MFFSLLFAASTACSSSSSDGQNGKDGTNGIDGTKEGTDPNGPGDGTGPDGADGSGPGDKKDGGGPGADDSGGGDDGGADGDDGGGGKDPSGPCTAGAQRCNGAAVEICNSSGTAWLYASTCSSGCSGAGLCTGSCMPGTTRCNGKSVETCAAGGASWSTTETCGATFCYSGQCAAAGLEVGLPTNRDGLVVVDGTLVIRQGASLNSPSGNLTIRATNIVVESGASITVSPVGTGNPPTYADYGGGGGYGEPGTPSPAYNSPSAAGPAFGSATDSDVSVGGAGAKGYGGGGGVRGLGGGVVRLIATDSISIAGTVSAIGQNGGTTTAGYGGGGGGSGGGILLAADKITITGSVSAAPGSGGGGGSYVGGAGGRGRIKILAGSTRSGSGTLTGIVTDALLPPLSVASSTHPDTALVYNDGFTEARFAWDRSFPARQGYYWRATAAAPAVPAPGSGSFLDAETIAIPRDQFVEGANFFNIASVDASSAVGKVETKFVVNVNTKTPTITSSSHPSSTTWNAVKDAFFQWTLPVADTNTKGVYYVLDHYGDTVPTTADAFATITKKQQLMSGLAPGVWVFHVVAQDQQGYLTKAAAHYRVLIGADPGNGGVLGRVTDAASKNVAGATVTVNRGLYTQTTDANGSYNLSGVPAGTWELRATKVPLAPVTKTVTVTSGASTTQDFTLN